MKSKMLNSAHKARVCDVCEY